MGLFDKFKKPKERPKQQRSGVMELIFCPAESLEHIMGRMEDALGVQGGGTSPWPCWGRSTSTSPPGWPAAMRCAPGTT